MYTLEYSGNKAGVSVNGKYIYEFSSTEEAKSLITQAEKIIVIFQPGNRTGERQNTPAERQNLKIKFDGYKFEEL